MPKWPTEAADSVPPPLLFGVKFGVVYSCIMISYSWALFYLKFSMLGSWKSFWEGELDLMALSILWLFKLSSNSGKADG